jgi:hypothetical protein
LPTALENPPTALANTADRTGNTADRTGNTADRTGNTADRTGNTADRTCEFYFEVAVWAHRNLEALEELRHVEKRQLGALEVFAKVEHVKSRQSHHRVPEVHQPSNIGSHLSGAYVEGKQSRESRGRDSCYSLGLLEASSEGKCWDFELCGLASVVNLFVYHSGLYQTTTLA